MASVSQTSPSKRGYIRRSCAANRGKHLDNTVPYQKWWYSNGEPEKQTYYDQSGLAQPPRDIYSSSDWEPYSAEVCLELETMSRCMREGKEHATVEFWRKIKGAEQGYEENVLKCMVDLHEMRERAVLHAEDDSEKAHEDIVLYERYVCRGPQKPQEPRADVGGVGITFHMNFPSNDSAIEPVHDIDTSNSETGMNDEQNADEQGAFLLTNAEGKDILDIFDAVGRKSESDNTSENCIKEQDEIEVRENRRNSLQRLEAGCKHVLPKDALSSTQTAEFVADGKSEIISPATFAKVVDVAASNAAASHGKAESSGIAEFAKPLYGSDVAIRHDIHSILDEAFDKEWISNAGGEEEQVRLRVRKSSGPKDVAFVRPAFRMSIDSTSLAAESHAGGAVKHQSGVAFPYFEVEINVPDHRLKDFRKPLSDGGGCIGIGMIRMPLRSHEERNRQRSLDNANRKRPLRLRNVSKCAEEPRGASVGVFEDSFGYYSDGKVKIGPFEGDKAGIAWALPMAGDTHDTLFVPDAAELYQTTDSGSNEKSKDSQKASLPPQLGSNSHIVHVPLPPQLWGTDAEYPKQWRTQWGSKTIVGCGVNIANGELFYTRNDMWAGSPHYRVRGKVPANQVEFQPMVTFKGNCKDIRIQISWGATVQEKCIKAAARLCGTRKEKIDGMEKDDADNGDVDVPRKSFDAVRINEIAYQSHFRGIIQHVEQECEVTLEDSQEREIDDVMHSYFTAQVLLHNADLAIGDFIEVTRAKPVIAESPELGWTTDKHGIKGVVCQVPPPGGAATFYSDCLAKSFVIAVLEKDYNDDFQDSNDLQNSNKKNDLQAFLSRLHGADEFGKPCEAYNGRNRRLRFVEFTVESEPSIDEMFRESPNAVIYVRKATDACARSCLSRRFRHICTNLPRFCNNPIGAALASASACKEVIKECTSSMISKLQILELKEMSEKFTQLACELVPLVSTSNSTLNGGQHDVLESVLFPRSEAHALGNSLQESAIAIALRLGSRKFCAVSQCVEHIDDIWKGAVKNSTSTLKLPAMGDYFGKANFALSENARQNLAFVCDVDFILAPIVRFGSNVAMLVLLLILHHLVVFEWVSDWKNGTVRHTQFSTTAYCYISLHMTFILGEVQDVLDHYSHAKFDEYIKNMWNYVDLLLHSIFLAYFFLQLGASEDWYPQYEPADLNYWAHRILGINSILLWVRFTSALSSNASLGPFIRMMSLMAKDVIKFLIFLGMYILGFAGTFYVWYFHAAKADDRRRLHENDSTARYLKGSAGGAGAGGGGDGGYGSYVESCITMFKASLGDFSFDEFLSMDLTSQYFGIFLLIGFLFLGAIMLLNLLIAILSHTYEKVQDQIRETFCFDKAQLVKENAIFWEGANTNIKLPPPFNALSLLVAVPILFLRRVVLKLMTPKGATVVPEDKVRESEQNSEDNGQQLLSLFNATTFMVIFGTGTVVLLVAIMLLRLVVFLPIFLFTLLWDSVQLCVKYMIYGSRKATQHASDSDTSWSDRIFVFLKSSRDETAYHNFDTGQSNTHCFLRGIVALVVFPIVLAAAIVPPIGFLIMNLLCFFVHFFTQGLFPTVYWKWREICDAAHLAFDLDPEKVSTFNVRERFDDDDFEQKRHKDKQEPTAQGVVRACCCFWQGITGQNNSSPSASRWTAERENRGKRWWPLFINFRRDQHMIKDAYSGSSVGHDAQTELLIEVGRYESGAEEGMPKHEKVTKQLARAVRDTALGLDEAKRPRSFCLDDFLSPVAHREASRYYDVDYELFLEELIYYMIYRFPQPVLVPINKLRFKVKDIMTMATSKAEEPDTGAVVQGAVEAALAKNVFVKTVKKRKAKKTHTQGEVNALSKVREPRVDKQDLKQHHE